MVAVSAFVANPLTGGVVSLPMLSLVVGVSLAIGGLFSTLLCHISDSFVLEPFRSHLGMPMLRFSILLLC